MTEEEKQKRILDEMEDDLGIGHIDLSRDIEDDVKMANKLSSLRQSSQ